MKSKIQLEREGTIKENNNGNLMTVIHYINYDNIVVQFENGYITKTTWRYFLQGHVKNPYDKTVHGKGFIGEGIYKPYINLKHTPQYVTWLKLLQICYDEKWQQKYPTHKNDMLCKEWHNFQKFAKWYDANYYIVDDEQMCLNKNLIRLSKIYSPATCVFLPRAINDLLLTRYTNKSELPSNIRYVATASSEKKYIVRETDIHGKRILVGTANNILEAFKIYKQNKESMVKQAAVMYKNKISEKIYKLLLDYKVDWNEGGRLKFMSKMTNAFKLIKLLRENEKMTSKELAQDLNVEVRMIRKYIEDLIAVGFNIKAYQGVNGGYYLEDSLNTNERESLKYAIDILKNNNFEHIKEFENAISKLKNKIF